MKENDENYFCRKLGSNPGPYDPETSAFTTMPQSHRVGAKFECQCVSNCFFDINQTGSPIIIPRPACSYLAAGKNSPSRTQISSFLYLGQTNDPCHPTMQHSESRVKGHLWINVKENGNGMPLFAAMCITSDM